ncbi:tail fiber domain-containing protein [Spartinivicinus marinus]|uniref:tail fiber domain-containing protein n=1 Tax=Spartinivicinus marinus TaxID=2994442 RepID=UPI0015D73C17|nr:tail fiber domain-containing protein [Spartinivicinus marinus]
MKNLIATVILSSISTLSHAYSHESCKHLTGNEYSECRAKPNFMRFSDAELKTKATRIDNALEKISKLNGVSFEWKNTSAKKKDIGVIAQNVEEVFPELVHSLTVTDPNRVESTFKKVNYAGLVSVLIEAVKELKTENAKLRQQLGL